MGQILYHKLSAEITGPDGREWVVSVEPPFKAPSEGEATQYEVQITRVIRRGESAPGIDEVDHIPEIGLDYKVPSKDGMFSALNTALNLVPSRDGND